MEQSIEIMSKRINEILISNNPSMFLFGSVVLDDFRLGWSDIDFICLTDRIIKNEQAEELLNLRQVLLVEYPGNKYFRLFEGIMMTLKAFLNNDEDTVVYWGTSGQRITNRGVLCPFGRIELLESGRFLFGSDFRNLISCPTRKEIVDAIKNHCETIRQQRSFCDVWYLDIARCLYTLKTNKVIAKTKAGEWAIEENICPDISVMKRIVEIRKNPLELKCDEGIIRWLQTLEVSVQDFADVLEAELHAEQ